MIRNKLILVALLSTTACAAATSGSTQNVSLTTQPNGASCQLTNDNSTWYVPLTPGSVAVHREASDLTVLCKKGDLSGTARVVSVTKALAFGNILAGGIIGVAIDRGNGAAFDYPSLINVPMAKGGKHSDILPPPEPETNEGAYPSSRR